MSINKCYDTWLSCLSLKAKQKYIVDQKKYGKFFALILGPLYKEDKNSNKVQSQFIFCYVSAIADEIIPQHV